jgi:hypothetical protein
MTNRIATPGPKLPGCFRGVLMRAFHTVVTALHRDEKSRKRHEDMEFLNG